MPLVSRKSIEEIKSRVDIHDVVSPYVQLKRSGANWRGLSPFNNEKTPSFFIIPDKNIFKCFSSGYAGDIFRFLQLKENLSFNEAIETIGNRFNIQLHYEESSGAQKNQISLNREILEIHEVATQFFKDSFHADNKEGGWIRGYWQEKRNFSIEVAKDVSIGYAPINNSALLSALQKSGKFSIEAYQRCGLFYARDHERDLRRFIPRFRGRLMIPIRDVQGRTIAFAGRQLNITPDEDPAKEAKYINSPETPIFHKSKTLFGIHHARTHINDQNPILLVEGQLDAIRCWEYNYHTAIAPQGTSITENQLSTIRRYTPKILCILDGDQAGQKAALRILPLAFKAGLEVNFVPLPSNSDPDSILAQSGNNAFDALIESAQSGIHFTIHSHLPKPHAASPSQKTSILKLLFDILVHCSSSVAREEYLLEITKLLNINRQAVDHDFHQFLQSKQRYGKRIDTSSDSKTSNQKLTTVEHQLLLVILNDDNIANLVGNVINTEWISNNNIYGTLLIKIISEIQEGLWEGHSSIDSLTESDQEKNAIYNLLSENPPFDDLIKTANMCIQKLYKNFINQRKVAIELEMSNTNPGDKDNLNRLQQERISLRQLNQSIPTIEHTSDS